MTMLSSATTKRESVCTDPALVRPIGCKGQHFQDIPGPVSQSLLIDIRLLRLNIAVKWPPVPLAPVAPADYSALPGQLVRGGTIFGAKVSNCVPYSSSFLFSSPFSSNTSLYPVWCSALRPS